MSVQELLDRYLAGPAKLREALSGLSEDDLKFKYAPAKWSAKEIALHVADMDLTVAFRMKRIIAEETPSYPRVDQDLWATGLHYQDRDIEPALRILEAVRHEMGIILARLPQSAWSRTGIHSEAGEQTLLWMVGAFTAHLEKHVAQIEGIRQRLGQSQTEVQALN